MLSLFESLCYFLPPNDFTVEQFKTFFIDQLSNGTAVTNIYQMV